MSAAAASGMAQDTHGIGFLLRHCGKLAWLAVPLTVASGFGYALVAVGVGLGAQALEKGPIPWSDAALFGVAMLVMVVVSVLSQLVGQRMVERIAVQATERVAACVSESQLATVEAVGGLLVVDTVSRSVSALRRGAHAVLGLIYAAAQLAGLLGALAIYATTTVMMLAAVTLIGFQVQNRLRNRFAPVVRDAEAADARFARLARHLAGGYRELLTSKRRETDLAENDLLPAATEIAPQRSLVRATALQAGVAIVVAQALLLVAAFVAPALGLTVGIALAVFVSAHAYESLQAIVTYLPLISGGGEAVVQLDRLTGRLQPGRTMPRRGRTLRVFREIAFHRVAYTYPGGDAPTVGPFDLVLRRGEVVFITGGNGSGKSTLMKLLAGLYLPSSGLVLIDGQAWHIEDQRGLFASVFTDYHLFDIAPEPAGFDPVRAEALLGRLGLSAHVRVTEAGFSSTRLSAGRRKRLALAQAILEDRPILLLDEWTADQDPEFRRAFFDQIIPELKAKGITVIAVTHDERFFHQCDRLVRLADGRIREDRLQDAANAPTENEA